MFLEEMSFTLHQDTLRIDLHPIYCNFVLLSDKNSIIEDSEREFCISRYSTLPELYINLCARLGFAIKDIEKEKLNYKTYLQQKLDEKTNQRTKDNDKNDKKNKKNKKDEKNMQQISLPPRMWTVVSSRNSRSVDKLLYPIPKIKKIQKNDKEMDNNNDIQQDKDQNKDKEVDKDNEED